MDQDGTEGTDGSLTPDGSGETPADLTGLISMVEELAREVEGLNARLARLEGSRPGRARSGPGRGRRKSTPSESVEVVMRPVPEIAMAAVAERALRKAEPVHSVEKADGSNDGHHAARYRVEVRPGTDLAGEVEKTLPIAFQASEAESGVLLFELEW